MGTKRARARRIIAASAIFGAAISYLATPSGAGVEDNKTYTVDIDGTTAGIAPGVWAGDVDATIDIVITNTGPTQPLGSVNVTVPSPFSLVSSAADAVPGGPVVELRNLSLAPGASVTATLTVDVRTCATSATGTFTVTAKQSNDYNGTGNDFFLDTSADLQVAVSGSCRLAFLAQPADAERTAVVSSVDYNPAGAPTSVEVRDAGNTGHIGAQTPAANPVVLGFGANPGAATLGGTTSATPVAGVATFAPTVSVSAFDYTLVATSTGLVTAPASSTFDIVDDEVTCLAGAPCTPAHAEKNSQTVTANFGQGPSDNNLLVSLGAADAPSFECTNYPRTTGTLVSQFLFTGTSADLRIGTFTATIPSASRPLNEYEVCWAAPYDFLTDSGRMASEELDTGDGTPKPGGGVLHVGTLPDCPKKGTVIPPCVLSRTYLRSTGTIEIAVRADGRDPWRY